MFLSCRFVNQFARSYIPLLFLITVLPWLGDIDAFGAESKLSGIDYKLMVDEYYNRGTPVDHPEMPPTLRWMPFNGRGVSANKTEIVPTEGNVIPLSWNEKGGFSKDFFSGVHSDEIKAVLVQHTVNLDKLANLLKKIGSESGVSAYDSGYLIIFDDLAKKGYIIKTSPMIAEDLDKIEFEEKPFLQGTPSQDKT